MMVTKDERLSKPLTHKQETFCQSIVEGMNQSDAYREAYSTENKAVKTVHEAASRLMTNPKVVARVAALRAPAVERVQKSYEKWLAEVEGVAFTPNSAIEEIKASDKLKGLELFGKATGYYQDKVVAPVSELEAASTATLVAMLAEVTARIKAGDPEVIEVNDTAKKATPYLPDLLH